MKIKKYKFIHIVKNDKFINEFYNFIIENFPSEEHLFIYVVGEPESKFTIPEAENVINLNNQYKGLMKSLRLSKILQPHCDGAEKIIFHSFYAKDIVRFLFFNQKFLSKSYWVMWGVDLYNYSLKISTIKSLLSYFIAKNLKGRFAGYITYLKEDYSIAEKKYSAKGLFHECLMYPSNLYKEYDVKDNETNFINIQVGNSADRTNNHLEVLRKLLPYKEENIRIYVPLSYGSKENANQVIEQGLKWFGDKFIPLTEFMPFEEYLKLLGSIDIAIFNHKRQQAMGNTITLLGLGKTVYIRRDTSQWEFFTEKGINVRDFEKLENLEFSKEERNIEIVKTYFSKSNFLEQLRKIFG
ncbi:hypothetical protein C3B51_09325 [Pseudoalteromonas rubra]|uniref:TDP-N-acetylfucosamine:lipid II N-acetylfucosaminyltransferase n=1 Tax=Pseudoalteromonas rubra TaxID=43658 RepID=A0A4Q7EHD5_9GAMM|nr:TDP-N-acetylfucosamine:lipid II N-acetylfucosaminyltransferase [Pseudoalteromonas rubra]RZM81179.1 hypothetical protein C3B51_09325 [Pseudoalteromonas rubra]